MDSSDEGQLQPLDLNRKAGNIPPALLLVYVMLTITIVLAGFLIHTLAMYDYGSDKGWQTPRAGATTEPAAIGYKFNIIDIDTEVTVEWFEYKLYDENGTLRERGKLSDVYELDMTITGANISFRDWDEDGQLSGGDEFFLRDINNGGPVKRGWSLKILFRVTDETVVEKTFSGPSRSRGYYSTDPSSIGWVMKTVDFENISDLESQHAASHVIPFVHSEMEFLLGFKYQGEAGREVQLLFKKEDTVISVENRTLQHNETLEFRAPHNVEEFVPPSSSPRPEHYANFSVELRDRETGETLVNGSLALKALSGTSQKMPSFTSNPLLAVAAATFVVLTSTSQKFRKKRRKDRD